MFRYRAVALVLFAPHLLVAGLIAPFNEAVVADGNGTAILDQQYISTGGPLSLTTSHSIGGGTFSVNLFAQSTYGILKAASTSSVTNTTSQVTPYAEAEAAFEDIVTISSAPLNGSLGLLEINYSLDATITHSGSFSSYVGAVGYVCSNWNVSTGGCLDSNNPNWQQGTFYQSSVSGTFAFPEVFTFTWGTPFDIFLDLIAYNIGQNTTLAGSGIADASDTLGISGISVFDSSMNPVTGYTYTTDTGTSYPFVGAVPEPYSWLLLGTGLFLVGLRRRA